MKKDFILNMVDMISAVLFFALYKWKGMSAATASLIACQVFNCAYAYWAKILSVRLIVTSSIVLVFAIASLATRSAVFIQMKVTILYLAAFFALLVGLMRERGYLRHVLPQLSLNDRGWFELSRRAALLFLGLAIANECVRQNLPEASWVKFKTFGVPIALIGFALLQIPLVKKSQTTGNS